MAHGARDRPPRPEPRHAGDGLERGGDGARRGLPPRRRQVAPGATGAPEALQPAEPKGGFFAWLDRVLDLLHDGGIAVDLATPTAAPPAWLEVNRDAMRARVVSSPRREDIALPIQEQLIVELYSK